MQFLANIRTFVVGLWIGAAVFFSFAVAPSVFSVLNSREMAGAVVNRTIEILNLSGLVIALVLFATSFAFRQRAGRVRVWSERLLLIVLAGACAFGQFYVAAQIQNIRGQLGRPIDEIAIDNPLRVAFNNLHETSVTVLSIAMISGLIIFFLLAQRANKTENRT